jgi:hypothetical protein
MNSEAEIDTDKIDEAALALLFLSIHNDAGQSRAWKGIDWEVMNRLHEKGYISDPKNKAKSVVVTTEGEEKAEALFYKLFSKK